MLTGPLCVTSGSQAAIVAALLVGLADAPVAFALAAQLRSPSVLVRRVIDGDTVDVASIGHVRLLGVAAPKIPRGLNQSAPSLAREARERLSGLLANRWIRLEYEGGWRRRTSQSAYVFLEDGRFVNEWLVREGLARVAAGTGLSRLNMLKQAEKEAQAARRGIWAYRHSGA